MERSGAQRWLLVNDKAENVWPVVKAFLQETGLNIHSEDQNAGTIETEWAENRARIPQGTIRSVIGKVFDSLYSSGELDQYRIRLERSKTVRALKFTLPITVGKKFWIRTKIRPSGSHVRTILNWKRSCCNVLMVRFGVNPVQAATAVTAGAAASTGAANLLQVFDAAASLSSTMRLTRAGAE